MQIKTNIFHIVRNIAAAGLCYGIFPTKSYVIPQILEKCLFYSLELVIEFENNPEF